MNDLIFTNSKKKRKAALMSGLVNLFLIVIKVIVGLFSGSISILAEAAHSGVDLLASMLAYFAVLNADVPADKAHKFGHGKIENISAVLEAVLVLLTAIWIIYEACQRFWSKAQPEFLWWGILVMLVSIVINYFRTKQLYLVANESDSKALEGAALHHKADIWTSFGVLVGLLLIYLTGWVWIDPLIAILMAIVIFRAGYKMTRENLHDLIDISLPKEEEERIRAIACENCDIFDVHRLRTRKSGSMRHIDMHLVFKKDLLLSEVHAICDKIEQAITKELNNCVIVLHPEPKKLRSEIVRE